MSPVLRIAVAAVAFGLIVAETIPLLANMEVRKSQESVDSGKLVQALDHAESARSIQPWAATPYLQLALVQELDDGAAERLDRLTSLPVQFQEFVPGADLRVHVF